MHTVLIRFPANSFEFLQNTVKVLVSIQLRIWLRDFPYYGNALLEAVSFESAGTVLKAFRLTLQVEYEVQQNFTPTTSNNS